MSESARIQAVAAPEPLRRWVAAAWRVDAPYGHEVHTTPDASIDLVIVANEAFDGIFVGGPLRAFARRALRGETRLVGLSLRPGLGALVGVSAGLFRFIEARAEAARFDARVAETIARAEQSRRGLSVASLARQAGLTERSLRRLFERHVGMPPAAYLRILRFNRALKRLRARRKEALAEAALSLGFADQSHLARDLRELGGVTATALQGHEPLALMSPAALI